MSDQALPRSLISSSRVFGPSTTAKSPTHHWPFRVDHGRGGRFRNRMGSDIAEGWSNMRPLSVTASRSRGDTRHCDVGRFSRLSDGELQNWVTHYGTASPKSPYFCSLKHFTNR